MLVPAAVAVTLRDRLDVGMVCGAMLATGVFEGAVAVWQTLTGTGAGYGDRGIHAVGTFGAVDIMAMANVVGYAVVVTVGLALTRRGRARTALVTLAVALVVAAARPDRSSRAVQVRERRHTWSLGNSLRQSA